MGRSIYTRRRVPSKHNVYARGEVGSGFCHFGAYVLTE